MKIQIRILFLSVIALVVILGVAPPTCTATPVTVTYAENPNDFKLTIIGGPIDADSILNLNLGTDWTALVIVNEDGTFNDELTISGSAFHNMGPHGEAPNAFVFPFNFAVNSGNFAAGVHVLPIQFAIVGHGQHFDQFVGSFSFTVAVSPLGFGDITNYRFDLIGVHTLTNQPIPEPATLLLLGTGLAGVAFTRWQRLKNRKRG